MFKLRDYQVEISQQAAGLLRTYKIAYLCLEVRTGKTLTAMNTANIYGAEKVLFVTAKKAIGSIQKDFEALQPNFELYVTNYESIHTVKYGWYDLVILDEAHKLSAFPIMAERAKIIKKLCIGKPIIFLSGTPSAESYSQIFHQLHCSSFSPFKEYRNFYEWAKDYVDIKKRYFYNRESNDYKHAKKEKVMGAINHLLISFTQEAAGFKQMVTEEILRVKMKDSTYFLAKKLLSKRLHIGANGEEVICDTEVKLQQKLHQVFSGTVKLENGEYVCFDDTKARFVADYFKGKKVAIFYCFKAELEILRWAFKGNITDSPEEFNKRNDLTFVCQIQSGSMGTNLSTADALIMFNIHFSALQYQQARARLQTKDRKTPAPLYWIFSENGIEEKIYEKVINKMDYTLEYFKKDYSVKSERRAA